MTSRDILLAVDIGGTFTDLVAYAPNSQWIATAKVLTTPDDPSAGVLTGVDLLAEQEAIDPARVRLVVHGTTLATNAIVQRKGGPTALLTTKGFRDVLAIARERRGTPYDLDLSVPEPLVPRRLRREVNERIAADGTVMTTPDEAAVADLIRDIGVDGEVKSIAVSFLHAYASEANEQSVLSAVREVAPNVYVSLSSEVAPEIREFERTSTTVVNAYVQPIVSDYLVRLERELEARGYGRSFFIMLSSGGITTSSTAAKEPVRIIESGPVGGVAASIHFSKDTDGHVLAFDMGGTTAKVALVTNGELPVVSGSEVARIDPQIPGSGFPIVVPTADLVEIGTGGGSIAAVNQFGLLKVGPISAGADPGPACYGRGGAQPTTTDADLVLGYLDPDYFVGGTMRLQTSKSTEAIGALAGELELDVQATAVAIHEVANETMANAVKFQAAKRGIEVHGLTMVATGGAGPVHGHGIAARLGIRDIIYPPYAGVVSSIGFLVSPIAYESSRTFRASLDESDFDAVEKIVSELEASSLAVVTGAGVSQSEVSQTVVCAMSYDGQGYELDVVLPRDAIRRGDTGAIREEFEREYERLYGQRIASGRVRLLTWRVRSRGPRPSFDASTSGHATTKQKGARLIWIPDTGMVETPVYDRYALEAGDELGAPAIIEERESTIVLPGPAHVTVLTDGSISARLELAE